MLEYPTLLVHSWARRIAIGAQPTWERHITDPAGRPIGFVRYEGNVQSTFFSWLRSVRLEIYETEDASHLMSVVRAWGVLKSWDVYDADERRVGSIYPPGLVDSEGQRRGIVENHDHGRGKVFDLDRFVLATFQRKAPSQLEVNFSPTPTPNPFLGMLILGSLLALDPAPLQG